MRMLALVSCVKFYVAAREVQGSHQSSKVLAQWYYEMDALAHVRVVRIPEIQRQIPHQNREAREMVAGPAESWRPVQSCPP